MSDDILDRAAQALDGVSEGPWTANGCNVKSHHGGIAYPGYETNARFIAAARSLVPELADEIINLRAERDQWQALWRDSVAEAAAASEERDKAAAASEPRRIETVEELDALPVHTVLRGHRGEVFDLWMDSHEKPCWVMAGGVQTPAEFDLPATVLYTPKAGD